MMVLTPFVSLMTTPYMVLVGMLSSRIGGGGSCREMHENGVEKGTTCWVPIGFLILLELPPTAET